MRLKGKKVLVVVASKDYRDEELDVPKAALEKEGAVVTIVSSRAGKITGMLGGSAKSEMPISDVNPEKFDAVLFVGGIGSSEFWTNPKAHEIAQKLNEMGKVVSAICLAPVTLAKAGLLKGKKATVWNSEGSTLKKMGANYTASKVEIDGNIITADGPTSADAFAQAIIDKLASQK